jgi:hypothetical protein
LAYRYYSGARGDDIWARVLERTEELYGGSRESVVGGSPTEDYRIYCASRTALVEPLFGRSDNSETPRCVLGIDPDTGQEWIHLVLRRILGAEPPILFEGEGFWTNADNEITYAAHDDATEDSDWGWETRLSDNVDGAAAYPHIVHGADALHAAWTEYNGSKQVIRHRRGRYVGSELASGSDTWSGTVVLEETFTVAAGASLTISPGTTVRIQTPNNTPSEDAAVPEVTSESVALRVLGQLLADGSEGQIRLVSTRETTPGEWLGIQFEGSPSEPTSSLTNVVIERATNGITLAGQSVAMDNVTFSDCSEAEILIEDDATVPAGGWSLAGPLTIGIDPTAPDSTGGISEELIEIIGDGPIVLDGTVGAISIGDIAASPTAGSWYGVWLSNSGSFSASGSVSIDDAAIGISQPLPIPDDPGLPAALRAAVDFNNEIEDLAYLAPPGGTTVWDSTVWDGSRALPLNFYVAAAGTLRILAGVTVEIEPGLGIEIRGDGPIFAEGTGSGAGQHATLTTGGAAGAGSWQGLKFLAGRDTAPSCSLAYLAVENPVFGVEVDSLSGTLFQPAFTNVQDHEIYMPGDTRIPHGHEWNLLAGTEVVAAGWTDQTGPADLYRSGQDTTRVELLVNGLVATSDPLQTGTRVRFTSDVEDVFRGEAWHGTTVFGQGSTAIDMAEFEYAVYPLSYLAAAGGSVTNSWFHHYREEAIIDWASDVTMVGNSIWRGPGLSSLPPNAPGRIGIHIADSFGIYEDNQVFHQAVTGIWMDYPQGWCEAPTAPQAAQDVVLDGCHVIGDPQSPLVQASGVEVSWACREHNITIEGCNVRDWPLFGLVLKQSSEVLVRETCVIGSGDTGIDHRRDKLDWANEDQVHNRLLNCLVADNDDANVRTDEGPIGLPNGSGLLGGVSGDPFSGGSLLKQLDGETYNWELRTEWPVPDRADTAQVISWRTPSNAVLQPESVINAQNFFRSGAGQSTYVSNYEPSPTYTPLDASSVCPDTLIPPELPGGAASRVNLVFGQRREGASTRPPTTDRAQGQPSTLSGSIPTEAALGRPRPNPSSDLVHLSVAVPPGISSPATLAVYDVAGRRVRQIVRATLPPGVHQFSWDLRTEDGRRVKAGVYFMRLKLGNDSMIRRVVVR